MTAGTVNVPPSTPPGPALFPMAMVTGFVALATTAPVESSTLTCTGGVIEAVTATLVGCTVKASLDAADVTVKLSGVKLQICVAVFTAVVQLK